VQVISESQERTVQTPVATMSGLAAPSQGSTEISTWRVRMKPDSPSPVHMIDREQIWMPIQGVFEFTVDDESVKVEAGQAVIVPGGSTRQFHAIGEEAEAIVCMPAGGKVGAPGGDTMSPIPWAV
jgi:quercetin dioxygenase-like cupin family protein